MTSDHATRDDTEESTRSRRPLVVFVVTLLVLAVTMHLVGLGLEPVSSPIHVPWWALALMYVAAELRVVLFHFRSETQGFTLTEVPLVVGLFATSPSELVVAAVLGTTVALLTKRPQRSVKLLVNVTQIWLATSTGVVVFRLLLGGGELTTSPSTWLPAGVAALVANYVSVGVVLVAIRLSEGRLERARVIGGQVAALLGALTSTALGLIVVVFLPVEPVAVLLLVGPLVAIDLTLRAHAAQRERTERIDFLYRSIQTLQQHPVVDDALADLLSLARGTFHARRAELLLVADDQLQARRLTIGSEDDAPRLVPTDLDEADRHLLRDLAAHGTLTAVADRPGPGNDFLAARGLQQVIATSLPSEDGDLGYLLVADDVSDVTAMPRREAPLFEALAAQVSVWLENGRLERTLQEVTTLQEQLSHQAYHDSLTGLPNRAALTTHVRRTLDRPSTSTHALLYIDIDDFKIINDTWGHDVGDEVLVAVARRLDNELRASDLAARLGGDEFAVVLRDIVEADADRAAQRIATRIEEPIGVRGHTFRVRASIGVAMTPSASGSAWLREADQAMYRVKAETHGRSQRVAAASESDA